MTGGQCGSQYTRFLKLNIRKGDKTMNLLSLLLSSMLAPSSVNSLEQKTNVSSALIRKLLPLAIPLLIKAMTTNASNQSGALSLLGALSQHKSTNTMDDQIKTADTQDGKKIVGHILGNDYDNAIGQLSRSCSPRSCTSLRCFRSQYTGSTAGTDKRPRPRQPSRHVRRRCTAAGSDTGILSEGYERNGSSQPAVCAQQIIAHDPRRMNGRLFKAARKSCVEFGQYQLTKASEMKNLHDSSCCMEVFSSLRNTRDESL